MATREIGWWKLWAPYWELFEEGHLGAAVVDRVRDRIEGPVLVVGAGQGLIVAHLRGRGIEAHGIDIAREMLREALVRKGLRMAVADGAALPFRDGAFRTVIVSTGVVDYIGDRALIGAILREALRVTAFRGTLLVAFYQLPPDVLRLYRRLGVVDGAGHMHLRRIFEISRSTRPWRTVPVIQGWTGRSYLGTLADFAWAGATLPPRLREHRRKAAKVEKACRRDGVDFARMIEAIPVGVPFRDEEEIRALLAGAGFGAGLVQAFEECVLVTFHKSPLVHAGAAAGVGEDGGKADGGAVIRTSGLCKRYGRGGRLAVDNLSLSIRGGSIFGLLGPNGAGKSTTLMMLCGLLRPTGGSVEIAPYGRGDARNRRKDAIGLVPQELSLYQKLTARENLAFFGRVYGMGGRALGGRIDELLEMTGLRERAADRVETFSSGMKRRLNLAVGLLHRPRIILLDEPTVGIDPQSRACILDAVRGLGGGGVTILYTTHAMEEAARLCDRVAIMDAGRILLEGDPSGLVARYGYHRVEFGTGGVAAPEGLVRQAAALPGVLGAYRPRGGGLAVCVGEGGGSTIGVVEAVTAAAKGRGVGVSLAKVFEPDLESLFLDLTGRTFRDAGGEGGGAPADGEGAGAR